jgi:hypothetical protein
MSRNGSGMDRQHDPSEAGNNLQTRIKYSYLTIHEVTVKSHVRSHGAMKYEWGTSVKLADGYISGFFVRCSGRRTGAGQARIKDLISVSANKFSLQPYLIK